MYASGNGTVVAAGTDRLLGNVMVVAYNDVYNHKTGGTQNVIARYYHLASILAKPGMRVNSDTQLALYGNTGKYSAGAHLHIEFDSNTQTPCASKTLGGNSNLIMAAATDTTIDPFALLHCKALPPDNQQIKVDSFTYQGGFYAAPECAMIPQIQ